MLFFFINIYEKLVESYQRPSVNNKKTIKM